MSTIRARAWVAAPIHETFAFFDDPANLGRIMPPPISIRPVRVEPSPPQVGTRIEFRYGIGPIQLPWTVQLLERTPPERIVDVTLSGPMRRFHHSHIFRPARRGGTWVIDEIDFHVGPDGLIGTALDALAELVMRGAFVWRHARQRRLLSGR